MGFDTGNLGLLRLLGTPSMTRYEHWFLMVALCPCLGLNKMAIGQVFCNYFRRGGAASWVVLS